jgi:hypothetical protein
MLVYCYSCNVAIQFTRFALNLLVLYQQVLGRIVFDGFIFEPFGKPPKINFLGISAR